MVHAAITVTIGYNSHGHNV